MTEALAPLQAEPARPTTVVAAIDVSLAQLQLHIDSARGVLEELHRQLAAADATTFDAKAATMLAANEQLVVSMLRTQAEAETAARDIAFRELTTQLRLESRLLGEENRQLSEASRLKSVFLSNMSHELRTPLNAIIGFTHLLRTPGVTPGTPKFATYLDHIGDSGQYLLELVNSLLDLTRAAAGKVDFHPEPVSLQQIATEVTDMLGPAAGRKGLTFHTTIDPAVDALHLDRTRLKQALANYVSNAVKFSHDGGVVVLEAAPEGSSDVRVTVRDSGIGIAKDQQARLFVQFAQVDNSRTRSHEGAGIGLALTKLLVEAQGGTVGLHSVAGQGSSFFFVLPRGC